MLNWIVLLTMAHGPTLAFLGYNSQEVTFVPLTQDTLYSDEHIRTVHLGGCRRRCL